ncbi:MAG TPA: peptidylprolyl isomerase [Polyangiaceae bacterium]
MMTRTPFLVLSLLIGACGAGNAKPTAGSAGPASASKAQECLRRAAEPHQPRPDAPPRIEVAHILVRHSELKDPQGATRTREQACLRALEALEKLQGGADWSASVEKYSDEHSPTHGSLGEVSQDELDPQFAQAAFSLEANQLSFVVETKRGFHVIARLK